MLEKNIWLIPLLYLELIGSTTYMIIYLFRSNVNSDLKFFSKKSKNILLLSSMRDIIDVNEKHKYFMR